MTWRGFWISLSDKYGWYHVAHLPACQSMFAEHASHWTAQIEYTFKNKSVCLIFGRLQSRIYDTCNDSNISIPKQVKSYSRAVTYPLSDLITLHFTFKTEHVHIIKTLLPKQGCSSNTKLLQYSYEAKCLKST